MAASVEKTLRRLAKQLIESTGGIGLLERMAHHAVPGMGLAVIANGEIASEGS